MVLWLDVILFFEKWNSCMYILYRRVDDEKKTGGKL